MSDDFILSSQAYKELLRQLKDAEAYEKETCAEWLKERLEADNKLSDARKVSEEYKRTIDGLSADLFEALEWLRKAERILNNFGYRRCDIPACNCNGYHSYGHNEKNP